MSESRDVPAVALLFADAELGGHLREALAALGARIVHQGPAVDVSEAVLRESGADVVVVNLEPTDEAYMEHLYAALESGPYQVVFNDAEASRGLSGWDKARWARHLAAKLVGSSDFDPPRPADARAVMVEMAAAGATGPAVAQETTVVAGEPVPADTPTHETGQSAQLEAELEALLVDDDAPAASEEPTIDVAPRTQVPDDTDESPAPGVDIEARHTVAAPSPVSDWELVDMTAAPPAAAAPADPQQFGIDKVSAESYFNPDGEGQDQDDSPLEPGLKLELVSLEESVAPTMADTTVSEMVLDPEAAGVSQAVVVSVGASGVSALEIFLSGLPASLPAVVMLLSPAEGPSVETLAATWGAFSTLPLTLADDGSRTRHGCALLVPPGHVCHLGHNGRVELMAAQISSEQSAVEQCLVDAADRLGAGLTAVMLAGADRGAIAGSRHVHGQGGEVWIQDPASCADDPTVTVIRDEGLAAFVGSPVELARHLCEANA